VSGIWDEFFGRLGEVGLDALVLGPRYDERAPAELRLSALVSFARSGLLLISGGAAFFEDFLRKRRDEPDPLDAHTRRTVEALVQPLARSGVRVAIRYPFWNEASPLPFQHIGRAAGLYPSILGLDLHPRHGPWMAYRALVLLDRPLEEKPFRDFEPCVGCEAPCIAVCPVSAVSRQGWDANRCFDHRLKGGCADGCHSRLACPVGASQRYPLPVLRYFQGSALACARDPKTSNSSS
jgi:hypothetical protein